MIDFSVTEKDIAISRARWEPALRQYAVATNRVLCGSRRLPIYDQAIDLAAVWLRQLLTRRADMRRDRAFVLTGDEHLHAVCSDAKVSRTQDFIFMYREAYYRWLTSEFRDSPWFWDCASWSINSSDRMLELASQHDIELRLEPNVTYLCSESGGSRGVDSILRIVDGKLTTVEIFSEWVVS